MTNNDPSVWFFPFADTCTPCSPVRIPWGKSPARFWSRSLTGQVQSLLSIPVKWFLASLWGQTSSLLFLVGNSLTRHWKSLGKNHKVIKKKKKTNWKRYLWRIFSKYFGNLFEYSGLSKALGSQGPSMDKDIAIPRLELHEASRSLGSWCWKFKTNSLRGSIYS